MASALQLTAISRQPPSYRNSASTGTTATDTTLVLSVPSGVLDGDLLLMVVAIRGGTGVTSFAASGWTSLLSSNQSTNLQINILYRRASSEPASYTTTWSGSNNAAGCIYAAGHWNGVAPALTSQANTGAPTAITAPTITPTKAPSLLLLVAGIASGVTVTPDAAMTERVDVKSTAGASNVAATIDEQVIRVNTPTGTRIATASAGANSIAALISINRGRSGL